MERTRVRARPLTAACVLFVCVLVSQNLGIVTAQTETLLVDSGVPPGLLSGGTGLVIFGSQFLAQQFTLPSDAVITAVEPYVGRNRALASPVVVAQITTSIGPATMPAAVLAQFTFTPAAVNPNADFHTMTTSLPLAAGTYFLILSSSAPIGDHAYWLIGAPNDIGPRFIAFFTDPAFPPRSDFVQIQGSHGLRIRGFVRPRLVSVGIDIKPGSHPNSIDPRSGGVITVALLSSPDFDATAQVDEGSLTFGRTGDEHSLAFCNASPEDVNIDGLRDLVCHFSTRLTGFVSGDTSSCQ